MRHDRAPRVVGLIYHSLVLQSWLSSCSTRTAGVDQFSAGTSRSLLFSTIELCLQCFWGQKGVRLLVADGMHSWTAFTFRHGYSAEACSSGVLLHLFRDFHHWAGFSSLSSPVLHPRDNTIPTLYMFMLPALPEFVLWVYLILCLFLITTSRCKPRVCCACVPLGLVLCNRTKVCFAHCSHHPVPR
ncbi:hypothetical protein V8F20_005522 [Naviculisporaceae sp. PSN 640]